MKCTESDFNFSKEKIIEMFCWNNFPGFTAGKCSKCERTANIINSHGWSCICGEYNLMSFENHEKTHENPDLGPSAATIQEAYEEFRSSKGV